MMEQLDLNLGNNKLLMRVISIARDPYFDIDKTVTFVGTINGETVKAEIHCGDMEINTHDLFNIRYSYVVDCMLTDAEIM